jgi:hypothetical protein
MLSNLIKHLCGIISLVLIRIISNCLTLERTEGKKSKNIMDSETDFIFNLALGNSKNGHIRRRKIDTNVLLVSTYLLIKLSSLCRDLRTDQIAYWNSSMAYLGLQQYSLYARFQFTLYISCKTTVFQNIILKSIHFRF